jgi:putative transposase
VIAKKQNGCVNTFLQNKPWLQKCPTAIRKLAVREAKSNRQSCFTNLRNGNITHFEDPYKTKKKEIQNGWTISLEKTNVQVKGTKLHIYGSILGEMKYCSTKQLLKLVPGKTPTCDCKIQKDQYGDYYMVVPVKITPKKKPDVIKQVKSIDPGVRKHATVYSNTEVTFYGDRWATQITNMTFHVDNLCSRASKATSKTKYVLKKQAKRVRKDIHNLKKEMRHQITNDIIKSCDLVLLPKLDTKDLVVRCKRRLTTKTAKQLLAACHGMFYDHIRFKCHEKGKHFLSVPEHYTSKTCPCCGKLNKCDETYKCSSCACVHDRDAVGALNIMLRAVRNSSSEDRGS